MAITEQHGYGLEIWADGTTFEGQYIKGMKQGSGEFKW